MADVMRLPLTFQDRPRSESEREPVFSEGKNEVRALSLAYLPNQADAVLREDRLVIKYLYDTQDRPKYTPEGNDDVKIFYGSVTGRVLEIQVRAEEENAFRRRIGTLMAQLRSGEESSFRKRHYEIIASSLEVFQQLSLEEGLM